MSDFHARIGWPEQNVPPRAPDIAPMARHDPPAGLAAFDWRWRHPLALRRLRRALASEDALPEITGAANGEERRRVAALLRGSYVAMSPGEQEHCIALAAVAAARAGIGVHVVCVDDESVARVFALIGTLSGIPAEPATDEAAVAVMLRADSVSTLAASLSGPRIVCGTTNGFALAWLRGGGSRTSWQRAAARLSGDASFVFSFAPLLLVAGADRVFLELVRQPLQLTTSEADAQGRFLFEVAVVVDDWRVGEHFEYSPQVRLLPAGEQVLSALARERAGLWAVPALVQAEIESALAAAGLQADTHYVREEHGLRWLLPQAQVTGGLASADDASFARLERALRARLGLEKAAHTRVRAWLPDYLLAYGRLGAAGAEPGVEWRDIWWLVATPVLAGAAPQPTVQWLPLAEALAPDVPVAFGLRALHTGLEPRLAGLPAERFLCLERPEDRLRVAALAAEGKAVQIIGPVASLRHLPAGISSIILLPDAPLVPGGLSPWLARLASRVSSRGTAGARLAAWIGRLALARQAAHQHELRVALLERMRQDRKTYAFTGSPRDIT